MVSKGDENCNKEIASKEFPPLKKPQFVYNSISNEAREALVKRVTEMGEKVVKAALALGINYSTAKSIIKVYRAEKRILKIPQKLRQRKSNKNKTSVKRSVPHKRIEGSKNSDQLKLENQTNLLPPETKSETNRDANIQVESFEVKNEEPMRIEEPTRIEEPINLAELTPSLRQSAALNQKFAFCNLIEVQNALGVQEYLRLQNLLARSNYLQTFSDPFRTWMNLLQSSNLLMPTAPKYSSAYFY